MRRSILWFVLILVLCACSRQPGNSNHESTPIITATPFTQPTATALLNASPPPAPTETLPQNPLPLPVPRYHLEAELDYWHHHLSVQEAITYTNATTTTLSDLLLLIEPALYPGTFKLIKLSWMDGRSIDAGLVDSWKINIPLESPLPSGEKISLKVIYELALPSPVTNSLVRPIPFGYTDKQTNLVDWYPYIPPYVPGRGWLAHPAASYGEHLVYDDADFQVQLKLVDPGATPLKVAASAPADRLDDQYLYRLNQARNFAFSVSHLYQVITQTVGNVTVVSYGFPVHPDANAMVLDTTAKSLALYSRLYSPYPHSQLSVVEADFLDGMEYDGLYFLSDGFYNLYRKGDINSYLVAIAAHETAHQWFYGLVANDQALEPWLDEALCTYNERLFFENIYPQALSWWWEYRVKYYQPQGWVNTSIYDGRTEAYRTYRDAVYLNGALFLEEVRKAIGDAAFFAFLKDYVITETHQISSFNAFFSILNKHSQVNLADLEEKYFKMDK